MKISHEDRFSDVELFRMFTIPVGTGNKQAPLWGYRKRPKGTNKRMDTNIDDTLKPGVSAHPPGSKERVSDLAEYYTADGGSETSPFEV